MCRTPEDTWLTVRKSTTGVNPATKGVGGLGVHKAECGVPSQFA